MVENSLRTERIFHYWYWIWMFLLFSYSLWNSVSFNSWNTHTFFEFKLYKFIVADSYDCIKWFIAMKLIKAIHIRIIQFISKVLLFKQFFLRALILDLIQIHSTILRIISKHVNVIWMCLFQHNRIHLMSVCPIFILRLFLFRFFRFHLFFNFNLFITLKFMFILDLPL